MSHLIGDTGHTPGATADVDFEAKVEAAFAPRSLTCDTVNPLDATQASCHLGAGHTGPHYNGKTSWTLPTLAELNDGKTAQRVADADDLGDAIQASLDALPTAPPEAVTVYRDARRAYLEAYRREPYAHTTQARGTRLTAVEDVFVACGWEIPS